MRTALLQTFTKGTKSKRKKHTKCKACGCANLVISGPDQFCTKCDWHSCIEYVEKGYMNNLHYAFCDHFKKPVPPKFINLNQTKESDPIKPDTSNQIKTA